MFMPLRERGLGLQLFFENILLTLGTEFDMSRENAFIGFNVITNEKF